MMPYPEVKHPLSHDPEKKVVRVGDREIWQPQLVKWPEHYWEKKIELLPPGSLDIDIYDRGLENADMHRLFVPLLGPKFARRYQAAHYHTWIAPHMTQATANMLTFGGKHWKIYCDAKVEAAHNALPYIQEAERDNLLQLIPLIVLFQASPQEMKSKLGRGLWRRLSNNSKTRNLLILQTLFGFDAKWTLENLDMVSGMSSSWLKTSLDVDEWAAVADRIAPNKRRATMRQAYDLVKDCHRMLGDDFNPAWSLARIRQEHHDAARAENSKRFSAKEFAEPWHYSDGEWRADLLKSPLEVADEGRAQRHCVASFAKECQKGRYVVMAITGPERATLGMAVIRGMNGRPWTAQFSQLYGAYNSVVSESALEFSKKVIRAYNAEIKRAADLLTDHGE